MSDIEVVIKIPEGLKDVFENRNVTALDVEVMRDAIKNGTPLPKDHGRLIDADEAIKTLKSLGNRNYRKEKGTIQEAEKMLSFDEYTPTIIEADKEVEDEQHTD